MDHEERGDGPMSEIEFYRQARCEVLCCSSGVGPDSCGRGVNLDQCVGCVNSSRFPHGSFA
jgi:hypothetical protein